MRNFIKNCRSNVDDSTCVLVVPALKRPDALSNNPVVSTLHLEVLECVDFSAKSGKHERVVRYILLVAADIRRTLVADAFVLGGFDRHWNCMSIC